MALGDLAPGQLRQQVPADYNVPAQRFGLPVGDPLPPPSCTSAEVKELRLQWGQSTEGLRCSTAGWGGCIGHAEPRLQGWLDGGLCVTLVVGQL